MLDAEINGSPTLPHLFSPVKIGPIELKNRIVLPAIGTHYHQADGHIGAQAINYFETRARGGAGLIMLEGNSVVPIRGAYVSGADDSCLPGLQALTRAVHRHGARMGIQLWHPGRQAEPEAMRGKPLVAPSAVPLKPGAPIPQALTREQIQAIVAAFADAAARAAMAGADLVELHAAHGYLLSQFLSPAVNKRDDEYGGSPPNRARILVEIIHAIRSRIGPNLAISARINAEDYVPGGLTLSETEQIAPVLEEAGLNVISISAGMFGSYPSTIPYVMSSKACFLPLAARIRQIVKIPVIAVGRINDPRLAEEILAGGKADLIAMARASLADPEFPNKARQGDFDHIQRCIACNKACADYLEKADDSFVSCLLNPSTGRETEMALVPAASPRRVWVAGSGPAGLEAAMVAASRGHQVEIFETLPEPGGQFRLAAAPPGKDEFRELIRYRMMRLNEMGVPVHLSRPLDRQAVAQGTPDVVVVATGAVPVRPPIPGADLPSVVQAWDVLSGRVSVSGKVLMVGGGAVGLETAHLLAEHGCQVQVVEMRPFFAPDMGGVARWYLRTALNELKVPLVKETRVVSISPGQVRVMIKDREECLEGIDHVVLAVGARPVNSLTSEISDLGIEIHVIGDAKQPRSALEAVFEGATIGRLI